MNPTSPPSPTTGKLPLKLQGFRAGAVNWTVLLWAVGIPLPIVIIVALMRGCS